MSSNFLKPKVLPLTFLVVNNHIFLNPSNYEANNYTKSPEKSIFRKNADISIKFCKL